MTQFPKAEIPWHDLDPIFVQYCLELSHRRTWESPNEMQSEKNHLLEYLNPRMTQRVSVLMLRILQRRSAEIHIFVFMRFSFLPTVSLMMFACRWVLFRHSLGKWRRIMMLFTFNRLASSDMCLCVRLCVCECLPVLRKNTTAFPHETAAHLLIFNESFGTRSRVTEWRSELPG